MIPTVEHLKSKFFVVLHRPGARSVLFGFRNSRFGFAVTAGIRYKLDRNVGLTAHAVSDHFVNGPVWTAISGDFSLLGFGSLVEIGVITGKRVPLKVEVYGASPPVPEPTPADAVSDPILDNGIVQS